MIDAPVLTAGEMRAAEQALFAAGTDEYALMERAGAAAAEIVWRSGHLRDTLILCGPGNNGGDGFVIARLLRARGVPVRVAATGESRTASARRARALWDGPVETIRDARPASLLVDALFGTGLSRGLDAGLDAGLVADLARLAEGAAMRVAIDLPSGVGTDDGAILSAVPRHDVTIALGALKPAHLLQPAAELCGRVVVVDIGIAAETAAVRRLDPPRIVAPAVDSHKYRRGLVAILGGAMPGAAALAAESAARAGAGYVRLVSEDSGSLSHAIVRVNREDFSDPRIAAVLAGPGLGRDAQAREKLRAMLACGHKAVLDADALHLLANMDFALLPDAAILTPHEGEFATLFVEVPGSRIERARIAAERSGAVVVLKGPDSIVAAPDGRVRIANRASSWLSTAGTGDVLAGICVGRLAVTGDPFRAACEAVWLHGEAARRAGAAFVADDLIAQLPAAIAARL